MIKLVKRVVVAGSSAYLVQEEGDTVWAGAHYKTPMRAELFRQWWVKQDPQLVLDITW